MLSAGDRFAVQPSSSFLKVAHAYVTIRLLVETPSPPESRPAGHVFGL